MYNMDPKCVRKYQGQTFKAEGGVAFPWEDAFQSSVGWFFFFLNFQRDYLVPILTF